MVESDNLTDKKSKKDQDERIPYITRHIPDSPRTEESRDLHNIVHREVDQQSEHVEKSLSEESEEDIPDTHKKYPSHDPCDGDIGEE
jgi:hypothetical protein